MNQIVSVVEHWLVRHPLILNFQWKEGETAASTRLFLVLTLLCYLSLTLVLSHAPLPRVSPGVLKPISAVHNLALLVLSLAMAVGCALSSLRHAPHLRWLICLPPGTPPSGPLFFWAYLFYLSKILELLDTLLIILAGSLRRLTFLHVYHHSTVLIMSYLWLHTAQSLFPVALVTNAAVHVVMYGYYFLCCLGVRPTWKRLLTDCQILQFVFSFVVSGHMLALHFGGSGCSGFWAWCFNALFNASLLALFLDFHFKNYAPNTNIRIRMESKSQ